MHVTDSRIIDKLQEEVRRDRMNSSGYGYEYNEGWIYPEDPQIVRYWKGVDPTRENIHDIEVFMNKARVLYEVDKGPVKLKAGDRVRVIGPAEFSCRLYSGRGGHDTIAIRDNKDVPLQTVLPELEETDGFRIDDVSTSYNKKATIGKGFEETIAAVITPEPGKYRNKNEWAQIRFYIETSVGDVLMNLESREAIKFINAYKRGHVKKV